MERGEDWEYAAVKTEWVTLDRQRRVTKRLIAALFMGLLALSLIMLAVAPEACIQDGGSAKMCDPVTRGTVADGLIVAGLAALGSGLWLCVSATLIQVRHDANGY